MSELKYIQMEAPDDGCMVDFLSEGVAVTVRVKGRKLLISATAVTPDRNSSEFRYFDHEIELPEWNPEQGEGGEE